MDLHLGEPLMHLVPMTRTSHPEEYRAYRAKLGPYGVAPAPPVHHAPAAGGVGGIDASALAEAMLSQAEKEERKKLAEGSIMLRGINVGGTIDEATGVVSDTALPRETEAFKDVCKSTSASEMTAALKRILDTNNQERVAGNVNATHRDMRDMDRLAVANLATGNWSCDPHHQEQELQGQPVRRHLPPPVQPIHDRQDEHRGEEPRVPRGRGRGPQR